MTSKQSRVALVTGASGGIGQEIAKLLAQDGHDLVLVARSTEKLGQFADEMHRQFSVSTHPISLDLSSDGSAKLLNEELQKRGLSIEVLVNNAAYGVFGNFAEIPLEDSMEELSLNIAALTALTRLLLPAMIAKRWGRILNVASTAGFQPGPNMAVYYASKAYVISFSEAIASELKGSGVTVTCLCPGPTDTGFQGRAGVQESRLFKMAKPMTAKAVARDGYRAMKKGKTLTISGFRNWLLAEAVRISPRKMATAVSKWVAETPK